MVGAPVLFCSLNIATMMRVADDILAASHSADPSASLHSSADQHYSHPGATLRFGSSDRYQRRRLGSTKQSHSNSVPSAIQNSRTGDDIHIFQISRPHSGSTLLNCILQGLLEESLDTGYAFLRDAKAGDIVIADDGTDQNVKAKVILHDGVLRKATPKSLNATKVTKVHSVDVDDLQGSFGNWFETSLYVASTRDAKGLDVEEKYCAYPNVICLDYDDFVYEASPDEDVATKRIAEVVGKVRDELTKKFDLLQNTEINIDRAVRRVRAMEEVTKNMIELPFDEHERRFGIHGGHRNRDEKEEGEEGGEQGLDSTKPIDPRTLRFVHLTSLYSVEDCEEQFCPYGQDQSLAVASMQRAKTASKVPASVVLATSVFADDHKAVPDGFLRLPDLERSTTTEYPSLIPQKNLPFVDDVFSNLRSATAPEDELMEPFDYVIYTNADIIVRDDFYDVISIAIQQGYDAFTINRQTIDKGIYTNGDNVNDEDGEIFTPYNADDLDMIYKTTGDIHPGSDCFVMRRSIFDKLEMGNIFLGYPPFGKMLLAQIEHLADRYTTFASDELKVTFHLGNDKKWFEGDSDGNCAYARTNIDNTFRGLRHIWANACDVFVEEDSSGVTTAVKHVGGKLPSRTCALLVQKFRNVEDCSSYNDDEIELGGEPENIPHNEKSPIVFQFLMGVEGTGHHLHRDIYKQSPMHERLNNYGLEPDLMRLTLSLWNRKQPLDGLFSAMSATSENNEDEWWLQEDTDVDGERLFDNLVGHLKRIEHKALRGLQSDKTLPPGTDLVVAINSGSIGTRNRVSPYLSYPLLFGPARALQYPDLDIIYEACSAAGVRCQHAVSYRDAYRVLKSTSINRQFSSRHIQLQILNSMLKIVQGQMLSHPDRLVACWESDKGLSGGVQDLGRIFGWVDSKSFGDFYSQLFVEPQAIAEEERLEITRDRKLAIYMRSMVRSMDMIKALCQKQLAFNRMPTLDNGSRLQGETL